MCRDVGTFRKVGQLFGASPPLPFPTFPSPRLPLSQK